MKLQPAKEAIPNNYFLKGCNESSIHDRQILESMQKRAIPETPNKKCFSCYQRIQTTIYIEYGNATEFFLVVWGFFVGVFLWVFFLFRFFGFVFLLATANKSLAQIISYLHYCIMVVNTELTAGEKASFIVLYMSNVTATQ